MYDNDYNNLIYSNANELYKKRINQIINLLHDKCTKIKFNEYSNIYIKNNYKDKTLVFEMNTGVFAIPLLKDFLDIEDYNFIFIDNTGYRYSSNKETMCKLDLNKINKHNMNLLIYLKMIGIKNITLLFLCSGMFLWEHVLLNEKLYDKCIVFVPPIRGSRDYLHDKNYFIRGFVNDNEVITIQEFFIELNHHHNQSKEIVKKFHYFNNTLKLEIYKRLIFDNLDYIENIKKFKKLYAIVPEKDNIFNDLGMGEDIFKDKYYKLKGDHYLFAFNKDKQFSNKVLEIIKGKS